MSSLEQYPPLWEESNPTLGSFKTEVLFLASFFILKHIEKAMDAFLKSVEALVFFVNSTTNSPRSFF